MRARITRRRCSSAPSHQSLTIVASSANVNRRGKPGWSQRSRYDKTRSTRGHVLAQGPVEAIERSEWDVPQAHIPVAARSCERAHDRLRQDELQSTLNEVVRKPVERRQALERRERTSARPVAILHPVS